MQPDHINCSRVDHVTHFLVLCINPTTVCANHRRLHLDVMASELLGLKAAILAAGEEAM